MSRFSCTVYCSNATAANANDVLAQLWNSNGENSLFVQKVRYTTLGASGGRAGLAFSSARGLSPAVSVTPDTDNHYNRRFAPPSACVIEGADFTVSEPTLALPYLRQTDLGVRQGAVVEWVFWGGGLEIAPTTGLCVANVAAAALSTGYVTFVWDE